MHLLALMALSLVLAYTTFHGGGVWPEDLYASLFALALLAALYWVCGWGRGMAPPPARGVRWLLVALPSIFALQIVPLPFSIVRLLSPVRFEVHQTASAVLGPSSLLTLSAAPAATFEAILTMTGCALVLVLARELAWRFGERPWIPAVPLIALAGLEALLGLVQAYSRLGDGPARGTYVNRNHFANLLAVCIPFPLAWGLSILSRTRQRHASPAMPVVRACILFAVAAVLLVGIVHSESRMGFISALIALAAVPAARAPGRGGWSWRWLTVPAVLAVAVAGFVFLPADSLIGRFAELASTPELSGDTRARIWRETMPLIRDYPVLGCGLGAYESVMARYKSVAPLSTLDFAHNDYIQLLAEGGVAGFLLVLALTAMVTVAAARTASTRTGSAGAYRAAACVAALCAMLLHSIFDFNLHIPANAMAIAWVGGLAAAPE